ncbi:MAG: hypothetical protein JWR83_935 [Aeromicrobium sp.]|nr:hypothetical protein [Aeromicrobium sp.]
MHEKELLDAISAAKWQAAPTIIHPNGDLQAAALLDAGGRRQKMPSLTELVRLVSSTPSVYAMLSISAHGARVGTMYSLDVGEQVGRQGKRTVQVGGFGLPPNFAIGLTTVAVSLSGRLVAGWNGLDASGIHASAVALLSAPALRRASSRLNRSAGDAQQSPFAFTIDGLYPTLTRPDRVGDCPARQGQR